MTIWDAIVLPPLTGQPVDQSNSGRAIATLQRRTDFLFERLNSFSAQNGKLTIQNVTIDSLVQVGDWVYYDNVSGNYSQAIAEGEYNTTLGIYDATPRSFVVGVCVSISGGLGAILMSGWIESLSQLGVNTSSMLEGNQAYTASRYYLSRTQAGKMTSVGGAPIVQLGFFSGDVAFVSPLQKDIFESHTHYKFDLLAKPSASQNTDNTGSVTISGNKYVDYFYSPSAHAAPNVLLAVKGNATVQTYGSEFRVEIYLDSSNKMGIDVYGGDLLDQAIQTSGTQITSVTGLTWPQYGNWYDVPNSGISIAFFRQDGVYEINTLASDIAASITQNTDRYKIFAPGDLTGWANVNPADGQYAYGAKFRYMRESDVALNAVWPPVPTSSVSIQNNGIALAPGVDFACFPQDLLWIVSDLDVPNTRLYSPWPYDYDSRVVEDENSPYFKGLELFFITCDISTSKSIVTTLQSGNPMLSITDCLTGEAANAGNLQIDLSLDAATIASTTEAQTCITAVDPTSQRFEVSPLVSRITAGTGIKLVGTSNSTVGQGTGFVTISADSVATSGEVSVVSLKNAKESLYNGITPCILFLSPSTARCQIVSKIKIPQTGLVGNQTISISASVFGALAVGATAQVATFKAVHYVLRNGVNLNSFIESNAFAIQQWAVTLVNYSAYSVLPDQYPNSQSLIPTGVISMSMGTINLVASQPLLPGDSILTVIERVSAIGSQADNYPGNIGLTSINWSITT